MNIKNGKAVGITAAVLVAIFAASLFLLCLLDGNIGGILLYQAITSGVFCVFLIYMVIVHSDTVHQPFPAYVITGFYLIVSLILCFPNRYADDFGIMYLIAIPIAVFYGFRYSLVAITAAYVFLCFSAVGNSAIELQHVIYAVIVCAAGSCIRKKGTDVISAVTALILQGIVLLLSVNLSVAEVSVVFSEVLVIFLNSLTVFVVYRLVRLNELIPEVSDVVEADETITDNSVGQMHVPITAEEQPIDYSRFPFDLSYLVSEECEVAERINAVAPRAFYRAKEIADFARRVSVKFAVNSDLVYAAALYHDIAKIYVSAPTADVILPECLYLMIKRQNEKQLPTSTEELIVLLSNHLLAIHHYMEKNASDISISKVIENIFNLQLKKGSIMSAGISMSLYHKMKQEFTNEFIAYLSEKTK